MCVQFALTESYPQRSSPTLLVLVSPFEKNPESNIVTSSRSPEGSDTTFYYVFRQHHNFSLSPDL